VNETLGVSRLEAAAAFRFECIAAARTKTDRRLVERRAQLASLDVDADATAVRIGSWGETTVARRSANIHRAEEQLTFGFLTPRL
jgi:hypothetical protein